MIAEKIAAVGFDSGDRAQGEEFKAARLKNAP
jgi:hypothetical protein